MQLLFKVVDEYDGYYTSHIRNRDSIVLSLHPHNDRGTAVAAARQDLEIFFQLSGGQVPHPIFDTQVAAMVLGYGDSISYDQLVQRITGDGVASAAWSRSTRRSRCPTRPT